MIGYGRLSRLVAPAQEDACTTPGGAGWPETASAAESGKTTLRLETTNSAGRTPPRPVPPMATTANRAVPPRGRQPMR